MSEAVTVSGASVSLDPPAHQNALDWIRGRGLTGAKEGCAEGECGACAILVACPGVDTPTEWVAVNACLVPAQALAGQAAVTADGLGTPDDLHPVQDELVTRGGSQCGYCTTGFVCSMAAEYDTDSTSAGVPGSPFAVTRLVRRVRRWSSPPTRHSVPWAAATSRSPPSNEPATAPELVTITVSEKAAHRYGVQCCGGEVTLLLEPVATAHPTVAVFGFGYVGLELARILTRHDLDLHLVDSRESQFAPERPTCLDDAVARVTTHHLPLLPEQALEQLAAGAHVLVMTHDHAEDLAICDAALRAPHLGSIGLIGSSAKWTRFRSQLSAAGLGNTERIRCPIGVPGIADKRPAAIALSVAAEILSLVEQADTGSEGFRRVDTRARCMTGTRTAIRLKPLVDRIRAAVRPKYPRRFGRPQPWSRESIELPPDTVKGTGRNQMKVTVVTATSKPGPRTLGAARTPATGLDPLGSAHVSDTRIAGATVPAGTEAAS